MTKHTKESLDLIPYPEVKELAKSLNIEFKGNDAKQVLVDAILAIQDGVTDNDQALQEQDQTQEIQEETIQMSEDPDRFMPDMKEEVLETAPIVAPAQDSIAQLALAIQAISQNQSQNNVAVSPAKSFLREYDTEEGKKVYRELTRKASRMVHVRVFKNNSRMRGERFVQFDIGNAVFQLQWNVRLNVDWYIPEILLDHIRSRGYQKIDTTDTMHPAKLGSGNAETSQNFQPTIAREYTVEVLEMTNKTVNQLLDDMALKRRHGFVPSTQVHETFDGLSLDL